VFVEQWSEQVFVERGDEIASLERLLEQVTRGTGAVVLVQGEAGIGKTTLVHHFLNEASRREPNLITASVQCTDISSHGDALYPFRQLLRQIAFSEQKEGLAKESKHFEFITRIAPAWISIIPGLGPLIAALIQTGVEAHGSYFQKTESLPKEQMFEQFTNLLKSLSEENSIVLFIDDLQWADSASISLLFHIARDISSYRLLLVCSYRLTDVELGVGDRYAALRNTLFELQRYGLCSVLFLGCFTFEQVEKLSNLTFPGNRFPIEFVQTLYDRSGGNPLFVTSFFNLLREQNIVFEDETGWHLAKSILSLEIPSQIESVISKQLERLTEDLRDFCDCASVEGNEFTYEVIATVLEQEFKKGKTEIAKQVRLLRDVHRFIRQKEEKQLSQGQILLIYSFNHGLLQEMLYHRLPPELRRRYHLLVGEALENIYKDDLDQIASRLAIHFRHGQDYVRSARYFYTAGVIAHDLAATAEAIYNFECALELLEKSPVSKRDMSLQADCYESLAHTLGLMMGQFHKAIEMYHRCLHIIQQLPNHEKRIMECTHMMGVCYRGLEKYELARDFYKQALSLARRLGNPVKEGNILRDIGTTYYLTGDLDTSLSFFQQSQEILSDTQDEGGLADTMRRIADVYRDQGDLRAAKSLYLRALEIQKRLKRHIHELMLYREMSALAFAEGETEEGIALAKLARDIGIKYSFYHQVAEILRYLAQKYTELQNLPLAFQTYGEAVIVACKCNPHEYRKAILAILGQIKNFQNEGNSEIAAHFCDVLIDFWHQQGMDLLQPVLMSLVKEVQSQLQTATERIDFDEIMLKWFLMNDDTHN